MPQRFCDVQDDTIFTHRHVLTESRFAFAVEFVFGVNHCGGLQQYQIRVALDESYSLFAALGGNDIRLHQIPGNIDIPVRPAIQNPSDIVEVIRRRRHETAMTDMRPDQGGFVAERAEMFHPGQKRASRQDLAK